MPTTLTKDMPILLSEVNELRRLGKNVVIVESLPKIMFEEVAERQCDINHGQTLERIRERGGLNASEAIAVLSAQPWRNFGDRACAHRILYIMCALLNRGILIGKGEL